MQDSREKIVDDIDLLHPKVVQENFGLSDEATDAIMLATLMKEKKLLHLWCDPSRIGLITTELENNKWAFESGCKSIHIPLSNVEEEPK